jgi:hypothetical protein
VCAIITAYYTAHSLAKEEKENARVEEEHPYVFPVVNCLRDDFSLRTEINYFLKANGIKIESLICRLV